LGSQSENRKTVLERAGYTFDVLVSGIDEKVIRHDDFYELPLLLAKAKAEALLPRITEPALLITADQVVIWNGELREKPRDMAEARRFLESYSNSPYPAECVNGVMITNTRTGRSRLTRETSRVYFSDIPKQAIKLFLKRGTCLSKAGGFDVCEPEFKTIIRIEGTLESVLGLPLDVIQRCIMELS